MKQLNPLNVDNIIDITNFRVKHWPEIRHVAEILVNKIRKIICPEKISTEEWVNIVAQGI